VTRDVITFPARDAAFEKLVDELVSRLRGPDDDLEPHTDALLAALRVNYRNVAIARRSQLSSYDETTVWYVFRDGRVRTEDAQRERLYQSLSQARDVVGRANAALAGAHQAAREAGYR
jgi:hypothetical protein